MQIQIILLQLGIFNESILTFKMNQSEIFIPFKKLTTFQVISIFLKQKTMIP